MTRSSISCTQQSSRTGLFGPWDTQGGTRQRLFFANQRRGPNEQNTGGMFSETRAEPKKVSRGVRRGKQNFPGVQSNIDGRVFSTHQHRRKKPYRVGGMIGLVCVGVRFILMKEGELSILPRKSNRTTGSRWARWKNNLKKNRFQILSLSSKKRLGETTLLFWFLIWFADKGVCNIALPLYAKLLAIRTLRRTLVENDDERYHGTSKARD